MSSSSDVTAACVEVAARGLLQTSQTLDLLTALIALSTLTLCTVAAVGAVAWVFRKQCLSVLLSLIDTIVGGVLTGPSLAPAIAALLEQPPMEKAIAAVVGKVLSDDHLRGDIAHVVGAVLSNDHARVGKYRVLCARC